MKELFRWALESWKSGTATDKQRVVDRLGEVCCKPDMDVELLAFYAGCLEEMGFTDESIVGWQRVLQLEPTKSLYWRNLGWIQLNTEHPEDALHSFETSIQLSSNEVTAHIGCAVALERLDRMLDAKARWRTAVALEPDNDEALYGLAKNIGSHDKEESRRLLEKCVQIDSTSCANLRELAITLDDWAEMKTMLDRAIQADPNDFWARVYLGSALLRTGHPADALESLNIADELADFTDSFVLTLKARAFHKLGNVEQAQKFAHLAVQHGADRNSVGEILSLSEDQ